MRTTITIDDGLLEELKRRAAEAGKTLSATIEELVRASLASPAGPEPREFRVITYGRGGARPGVDLERVSELLAAEDVETYGKARDPG